MFWARNSLAPIQIDTGITYVYSTLIGGAATGGADPDVFYLKNGALFWAENSLVQVQIATGL